jgi:hypothetical protein
MICEYLHQLSSSHALHPGPLRLVSEDLEAELVRFYLTREHDKAPITVPDMINLLAVQDVNVDRFWVRNFVMRRKEQLCFQKVRVLEKDRHDDSPDEVRSYFDTVAGQLKAIPSPFVWNVDETRIGCPKKIAQPEVIVATNTKPGSVTVPKELDDAQLTQVTAISTFGDSTCPLSIFKLKTFENHFLLCRNSMKVMITQFCQLHARLSQKFFLLAGLTQFFCCAFLSSVGSFSGLAAVCLHRRPRICFVAIWFVCSMTRQRSIFRRPFCLESSTSDLVRGDEGNTSSYLHFVSNI